MPTTTPPTEKLFESDTLRLLVVEDDFVQARTVRRYLTQLGYEVVGVAPTATEAERLFDATAPDLLLLDVNLAGGGPDGIDLAHTLLDRRRVPVIFLTSFQDSETFRRARAVAPAAFLNKPFDEFVLGHAIELAAQQFAQQAAATLAAPLPALPASDSGMVLRDSLWLREHARLVRVPLTQVQWLEADSNYCHLHTLSGRKYTARANLGEMNDRLPAADFMRVHRSATVRLAAIESIDLSGGEVQLHGGGAVPLGRAYRDELLARLELLP
jgi:DNA-binding LytR/AlgR family response regulator